MRATDHAYDGIPYDRLRFDELDWTEVCDHDPGKRSQRKGSPEVDVHTEWATEACHDPLGWVRAAGSSSGMTIKVTGWSPSAGFVVTVVVAAKDSPPLGRWWGATAWKAKQREVEIYERSGHGTEPAGDAGR